MEGGWREGGSDCGSSDSHPRWLLACIDVVADRGVPGAESVTAAPATASLLFLVPCATTEG
eukprot:573081-Rhodomonas_salina.1